MPTLAFVAQPIRVSLVEDQHVSREGLSLLIGASPGFAICSQHDSMSMRSSRFHPALPTFCEPTPGFLAYSDIEGVRRIHELMPVYGRLHVHSRSEAVWKALQGGLLRNNKSL